MKSQTAHPKPSNGRFKRGQSGNPAGRTKGSTTHAAELRRAEEDALALACHTADVIAETVRLALIQIDQPEFIPLFDAICDGAKKSVRDGEIGPSPLAMLRPAFDDFKDNHEGDFFAHIGLPDNCDWPAFEKNYRTRGRIDFDRFVGDYAAFPPLVQRIEELRGERLLIPVTAEPPDKLKNGFD